MNPAPPADEDFNPANREELFSALFANLVIQQSNLALMFLGKAPHPETGERLVDPESAQLIIDQLEMLESKTRGNLDRREATLLQQSLTGLRMAFVETIERPESAAAAAAPASPPPVAAGPSAPAPESTTPKSGPAVEPAPAAEESRKKFSKKY